MPDPHDVLRSIERTVSHAEVDGAVARRATLARTYPTDPADLWEALTDPDRIPRWFLPVSGELHEGGRYQFEGNAGGTIERCDPPRTLRVTWEMPEAVTWLTVTLTPADGGTRLELDHVGPVPDEFWAMFGPGATGVGWDLALYGLALHVDAAGAPVDHAEIEAWSTSPDGVAAFAQSSDAWRAAHVADGADPAEAAAAAARTLAFYTGQEPPADEA